MKLYGILVFIFFMNFLFMMIIDLVYEGQFAYVFYSLIKSIQIIGAEEYLFLLIFFLFIIGHQISMHLKNKVGN
ncbi:Uncharacterised protein [Mycobacteroides abscessus subsp. abscessus]|nr:Uncharacterised protein [Mycobacteroides abscessus subsp. abscessus]